MVSWSTLEGGAISSAAINAVPLTIKSTAEFRLQNCTVNSVMYCFGCFFWVRVGNMDAIQMQRADQHKKSLLAFENGRKEARCDFASILILKGHSFLHGSLKHFEHFQRSHRCFMPTRHTARREDALFEQLGGLEVIPSVIAPAQPWTCSKTPTVTPND